MLNRLEISPPKNGLYRLVHEWKNSSDSVLLLDDWSDDFSRDITPVSCHSHNDYLRDVPLYDALLAGCVSVEADIWLENASDPSSDLLVGHTKKSLRPDRTLKSLYLGPLQIILEKGNATSDEAKSDASPFGFPPIPGIFSSSAGTSLVLLLDFKMNSHNVWTSVERQLEPLREAGWLTFWTNSSGLIKRPITVVASGDALLAQVTANSTYRYIFYDAPLGQLNETFTTANSYYASAPLAGAVGAVPFGQLSSEQQNAIQVQVAQANASGLVSRYWDTPSWPIGWRNRIWNDLMSLGVGIINTDDVSTTARWHWDMCVVLGINLCL